MFCRAPIALAALCVLPCSSALTFNIDFGKTTWGTNYGNVEIVDDYNYQRFLNSDPFFNYQAGSQIQVNKASAYQLAITGPHVIIQCANLATRYEFILDISLASLFDTLCSKCKLRHGDN